MIAFLVKKTISYIVPAMGNVSGKCSLMSTLDPRLHCLVADETLAHGRIKKSGWQILPTG